MKTIIDQSVVLALAFGEAEHLSRQVVGSADILVAQERYIVPILGRELTDALIEGKYSEFVEEYVAPALAFAVRLVIQPAINLRLGDSGLVAPRGEAMESPDAAATRGLLRSLKVRTRELLKRLSAFVEQNKGQFAEYDSKCNIFNRCSIDGGVVQIL
ncbi:MAG: hypothetical protein J6K57_00940 [Alistipes sp.]|nr:hypothetical protein [Alistipes sp.]